jgi:glycosyltransferase involved in cell wall biosynthesis
LKELMIRWLKRTPRRGQVFYNGLPKEWLARSQTLPSWDDRPLEIISVSSVSPYKRQELVIRALPALIKRPGMADLVYRIVGHHYNDGYLAKLKKVADELGLKNRVVFDGRLPDDQMQQLLARARAFVLMSVCESFGLPAIEAMTFGTPVVTSNCCAMPEVCGNAAILSPVDDVAALTDNLYRVLSEPALAQQMRLDGAQNCQRFAWSKIAEHMATELGRMLDERISLRTGT